MEKRRAVLLVASLVLAATWGSRQALATPPAASAVAPTPDDDALLARLGALDSDVLGKTLAEVIRGLKTPEQRRAACVYVLAIVDGDVGSFMSLVPEKGLVIEKQETKTKEKVSWAEMQRRARARDPYGRPRFADVMNEIADGEPKNHQWGVQLVRGRLEISANGAFAWATLGKAPDGRFMLERITLSFNDD